MVADKVIKYPAKVMAKGILAISGANKNTIYAIIYLVARIFILYSCFGSKYHL